MASRDLLFDGEWYLTSALRLDLPRPISTSTDCTDWTSGMETGSCYCWTLVSILFAHSLCLNDRKGQLCNRGSAVLCHFRCFAWWLRLERNLYKTPIYRRCCDGTRHFLDCVSVNHRRPPQLKATPNLTLRSGWLSISM